MKYQKRYDDKHWKTQIQLANSVFSEGKWMPSIMHYKVALNIAKQLFQEYKNATPLPNALTPALVVSCLNLAECWAVQNKKSEQILCLIDCYDFLKSTLKEHATSKALSQQVYEGLSKTYLDLIVCLKDIEAEQIIAKTDEDFYELTMLHQSKLCVIH